MLVLPVAAPRGGNRQPLLHQREANFQTSGYTTENSCRIGKILHNRRNRGRVFVY